MSARTNPAQPAESTQPDPPAEAQIQRGFILQPTYRIRRGTTEVHLHGVLEDGRSFLVRDGREAPSFYVRAVDVERAAKLGAEHIEPTELRAMDGPSVAEVRLRVPSDAQRLRDRLEDHGVRTYEADVRFATRFLLRRGLRGAIEIVGEGKAARRAGRVDLVFDDPELRPADLSPTLTVLSIDIETDMRAATLFSVALFGAGASEVLLWCPDGMSCPPNAVGFATQAELLRATAERIRAIDPDVLTGWNVVDFDFRVLERLGGEHGVQMDIGRGPGALRLRRSRSPWQSWDASVPGRVVLDGIQLLRSSFVKMESYGLGAVAKEVLGTSKLIEGSARGQQITDAFASDRQLLVDYNLLDARMVVDILAKLDLVDLAVERSKLTGLPIDRVGGSIAAFDFLYMEQLWRRGLVAPSVRWDRRPRPGPAEDEGDDESEGSATGFGTVNLGGHVMEPETGLWHHVLVFDFKSLYPSIIRTFQIDPLGYLPDPRRSDEDDPIVAPDGSSFRRRQGILPSLLDDLFPRREEAKARNDDVASHAIKILMNSFYGVLGTSGCRFAVPAIAGSITAWGRDLLLWSKTWLEEHGSRVLYGDTDSLFVLSGVDEDGDPADALALGEKLVALLNASVAEHIRATWRVESRLELEFEKLYRKLLLPPMRGGQGGARKRYAGLVGTGDDAKVVFTGMEVVRRDWTELAKTVQRGLYQRLFLGEDPEEAVGSYLRRMVEEVREGGHDDDLVYRKALRKRLDEYTATTPPHVAAAKKLRGKPGRMIRYVITQGGPEPAQERRSELDHEHYVQKQVRPVAEPVLGVLGLDFDDVVGDAVQLSLF